MSLLERQYQVCECGDFAHAHENLTGPCRQGPFLINSRKLRCPCRAFTPKTRKNPVKGD